MHRPPNDSPRVEPARRAPGASTPEPLVRGGASGSADESNAAAAPEAKATGLRDFQRAGVGGGAPNPTLEELEQKVTALHEEVAAMHGQLDYLVSVCQMLQRQAR